MHRLGEIIIVSSTNTKVRMENLADIFDLQVFHIGKKIHELNFPPNTNK